MLNQKITNIKCRHWINTTNIVLNPNWEIQKMNDDGTYFIHSNIENSIHYQALVTKNFNQYNTLINKTNQLEHSQVKFLELYNILDIGFVRKNKIKLHRNNYILDGLHRICILLHKGLIQDTLHKDLYYYE